MLKDGCRFSFKIFSKLNYSKDICEATEIVFQLSKSHSYYIILNEHMQPYSPYPIRTPFSASSQPNLFTSSRQPQEPIASNNRHKSYLLQKVQALIPYLGEILRQNEDRTSGIVGKLSGLKDNLDFIFEDLEKELALSGEEN